MNSRKAKRDHLCTQQPDCRPVSVKNVPSISQGSVATDLGCSGIVNDDCTTNLLPSVMAKEI